jgi:hypothetical protein
MLFSAKLLPVLALAVALSPVAAQARRDPPQSPAQYYLTQLNHQDQHKQVRVSEVSQSSATVDDPSTIYGGVNANSFRDSAGG